MPTAPTFATAAPAATALSCESPSYETTSSDTSADDDPPSAGATFTRYSRGDGWPAR